eukprot:gene7787-7865_t
MTAYEKGCLRTVLAGAEWTQARRHDNGHAPSPVCVYCSTGAVEDLEHLWCGCPAWDSVRGQHPNAMLAASERPSWPTCLALCAIVPASHAEPPGLLTAPAAREPLTRVERDAEQRAADAAREATSERDGVRRVVVWTDGASTNNQVPRVRRAGVGIFYAKVHSLNLAAPLPGRVQTNNRAEILAITVCLERDRRPLDVRTDSEHSRDGWRAGRSGAADCAHATAKHVAEGVTTEEDRAGNAGADDLATQGAEAHAVDSLVAEAVEKRVRTARHLQRMFVAIQLARNQQRLLLERAPAAEEEQPEYAEEAGGQQAEGGAASEPEAAQGGYIYRWDPPGSHERLAIPTGAA